MAQKIRITPNRPIGLHLTVDDREAILEAGVLDAAAHEMIQKAPIANQNTMLTLTDLSLLGQNLAAAINHTKDRRLGKKLDRIIERIGRLKDTFEEG